MWKWRWSVDNNAFNLYKRKNCGLGFSTFLYSSKGFEDHHSSLTAWSDSISISFLHSLFMCALTYSLNDSSIITILGFWFVLILYFHLNYLILFLPCFCLKIYGFWISCLCSFIGSVWWPKKFRKTKGSGLCILKNPHSTKRNGTIVFGKVVQETQKRETQTRTHRR